MAISSTCTPAPAGNRGTSPDIRFAGGDPSQALLSNLYTEAIRLHHDLRVLRADVPFRLPDGNVRYADGRVQRIRLAAVGGSLDAMMLVLADEAPEHMTKRERELLDA